jgi:hypothetical protein
MKAKEMADRCECGKKLPDRHAWRCGACARKDVAMRAKAGIEGVQRYRRDGETERDFIARLESRCPQCCAKLDRLGAPGRLGCPACEWTNPYTLLESLRVPAEGGGAGADRTGECDPMDDEAFEREVREDIEAEQRAVEETEELLCKDERVLQRVMNGLCLRGKVLHKCRGCGKTSVAVSRPSGNGVTLRCGICEGRW